MSLGIEYSNKIHCKGAWIVVNILVWCFGKTGCEIFCILLLNEEPLWMIIQFWIFWNVSLGSEYTSKINYTGGWIVVKNVVWMFW